MPRCLPHPPSPVVSIALTHHFLCCEIDTAAGDNAFSCSCDLTTPFYVRTLWSDTEPVATPQCLSRGGVHEPQHRSSLATRRRSTALRTARGRCQSPSPAGLAGRARRCPVLSYGRRGWRIPRLRRPRLR